VSGGMEITMKNLDKNQKIAIISLAIFIIFIIAFSALSSLVQSDVLPDFTSNPRIQGLLSLVIFCPLCASVFFAGRYFKSKSSKIGGVLTFVSLALFIFGIFQALLALLGAYGA